MAEEIAERLGDEAADLRKLFKAPSAEQVAQIVAESSLATGVSPNIDAILGIKAKEGQAAAAAEPEYEDTPGDEAEPVAQEAAPVAQAAPAPAVAPQQAAPAPQPAAAPKAAPAPAAMPQTSAETVSSMSDADFLASLGLN